MSTQYDFVYDSEADSDYLHVVDDASFKARYKSSEEVRPVIILDMAADDTLLGSEIVDVSRTAPDLLPASMSVVRGSAE